MPVGAVLSEQAPKAEIRAQEVQYHEKKSENTVFQLQFSCDLYTSCQSHRTVSKNMIELQVTLILW